MARCTHRISGSHIYDIVRNDFSLSLQFRKYATLVDYQLTGTSPLSAVDAFAAVTVDGHSSGPIAT